MVDDVVGVFVGDIVGLVLGGSVGTSVGIFVGDSVGRVVGITVGLILPLQVPQVTLQSSCILVQRSVLFQNFASNETSVTGCPRHEAVTPV